MGVYESIIAGLNEAIEDARSERGTLKRNTVSPETEHVTLSLEIAHHRTNLEWFDARDNFSSISIGMKTPYEDTAESVVWPCAA